MDWKSQSISHLMFFCSIIIVLFWIALYFLQIVSYIYGRRILHKRIHLHTENCSNIGVSILKPLLGLENNLKTNLESFFNLSYQKYEIIFCIDNSIDASLKIVKHLIQKYPHVDARVVTGHSWIGVNPKINNLVKGYEKCKYDLILISDSRIFMDRFVLCEMVSKMTFGVGIVYQLPFVPDSNNFLKIVEKIYFGAIISKYFLISELMGFSCHIGMSSLIRKSAIEAVGGLKTFSHYIDEDNKMSKTLLKCNWKIVLSSYPAIQNHGLITFDVLKNRFIRWTRMRYASQPYLIIIEPVCDFVTNTFLTSLAVNFLFGWNIEKFVLWNLIVKLVLDWLLLKLIQKKPLLFGILRYIFCWCSRELFSPYLYLLSMISTKVVWRKKMFSLHMGGIITEHNKIHLENV